MEPEQKKKAALLALAVFVIVLALVGIWIIDKAGQSRIATKDDIQTNLVQLMRSKGYKEGGRCLAEFESGARAYDPHSHSIIYERCVASQRALIDFERTFTPSQIETMRTTGAIPFESLDSNQQNQVRLVYKYCQPDGLEASDIARSKFRIVREPSWMHLDWITTEGSRERVHSSYVLADESDLVKESLGRGNK